MATHSPQSRVVASRVNETVGRLRERGHRLTRQRYAVVRALVEGGEHPSAEQLFHLISDAYPMMSRATVYKTLDTLNAAGEVLELEFRRGAESLRREHSQRPPARGVHGLRPDRRRQAGSAGPSVQEVAEQMGYQISGYRLDFYGLCPTCLADGRGCRHPSRISCTGATLSSRAIHR
jgi:Fur family peroxide stress response transcriptional regulator